MRFPDDPRVEVMRGSWLDHATADRLLSGQVAPDDAPPGFAGVALLVRTLAAPPTSGELVRETDAIALASAILRSRANSFAPPPPSRTVLNGHLVRPRFFRTKIAALVVVGALIGTSGLAVAGVLPDPAQDVAATVLSTVGIRVPTSDDDPADRPADEPAAQVDGPADAEEHPASTGSEISEIATTTDATGVEKGAQISDEASGGKAQVGEHGRPSGSVGPQSDRGEHGRRIAEEASDGRSGGRGNGN